MKGPHPARDRPVAAQPTLGGRVGDDPMPRRPARAEELGEDRVVRTQQPALVLGMSMALLGEQEPCADDDRVRAGRERDLDVAALGDAAGEPDRALRAERSLRALEQLCAYLKDPANGIWPGTVAEVGAYVRDRQREAAAR